MVVTDATGAEPVSADGPARTPAPDPFCEIESSLLLAPGHRPQRRASRGWFPGCRRRCAAGGCARWVSTATACGFASKATDGDHDIRLPFHKPVDDMTGLSQAIRVLMGCPFINGLRARH